MHVAIGLGGESSKGLALTGDRREHFNFIISVMLAQNYSLSKGPKFVVVPLGDIAE